MGDHERKTIQGREDEYVRRVRDLHLLCRHLPGVSNRMNMSIWEKGKYCKKAREKR